MNAPRNKKTLTFAHKGASADHATLPVGRQAIRISPLHFLQIGAIGKELSLPHVVIRSQRRLLLTAQHHIAVQIGTEAVHLEADANVLALPPRQLQFGGFFGRKCHIFN